MTQRNISVWFVCRLCRGSFGQVDAFIEHKKQKHFTQFQNTTSIIFEEREPSLLYPVITNNIDHEFANEGNEPRIKMEVNDEDPIIPFSSEIIDEPNVGLFKPKSELIFYESETSLDNENSSFGSKKAEQNPYVLLKRLTSEQFQRSCNHTHHSTLLKCEQNNVMNDLEPPGLSADVDSNSSDLMKDDTSTDNRPSLTVRYIISTEGDLQYECKLCSKKLHSEAQLKIHVGICALYHEDRNRFCVICNRRLNDTQKLKEHHLRFHGTEEEKSSLYKFKCHLCPKQYRISGELQFHLKSHKETKDQVESSDSNLQKCPHQNCGKEFRFNCQLQRHILAIHLRLRPFSCSFPNCNKTFSERSNMDKHFVASHRRAFLPIHR